MPGVAATALCGEVGPVGGGSVFLASPVHCVPGMSGVRLAQNGRLDFEPAEAQALASDFKRVFGSAEVRLIATPSGKLFSVFDTEMAAVTNEPAAALGRDIGDFLPSGTDAPRLRRLLSELEMWLFEHPVNLARAAAGRAVVTGLWLWGGGGALTRLPVISGWTAGSDPLFGAWSARAEFPRGGGSGVVVLTQAPGADDWAAAESQWIAPALEELRSGRIRRLELCAGERRFIVSARWALRIWRRARPWWEQLM